MKLKYILDDADIDKSISLVSDLKKAGIITDPDNQILSIDDNEVIIDGVSVSEELTDVVKSNPGFEISLAPDEASPFKPESGLPDVDKIGTVQSPIYHQEEITDDSISEVKTFSESEIEENSNSDIEMKKNFNEPALDENGVAVEKKETAVVAEQASDDSNYQPAEGSLDSFDVPPFTDEEIDQANDVTVEMNGNDGTKVFNEQEQYQDMENVTEEVVENVETFSDEEIDAMPSEEAVAAAEEDLEEQVDTFSNRKKRLYAAKARLKRKSRQARKMKSFAEELTETETKDVIEDIVAILQDAPEIKSEVMEQIEDIAPEADGEITTAAEEVEETTVVEPEVSPEVTEETPAEVEDTEEVTLEGDIDSFSEEEIEAAPEFEEVTEVSETDVEPEVTEDPAGSEADAEDVDYTEAGETFCKTFSDNSVQAFRRKQLDAMARKAPHRNWR